jgi:ribosomal protein S18 acetylase RimI-like enzyme
METDSGVHAHLSSVLVAKTHRRRGIGTNLVKEAFSKTGAKWVNVLADSASATGFYRSFVHRPWTGFRLYPQYDKDPAEQGAEGDAATGSA